MHVPINISEYPNMNARFPFHISVNTINKHFPTHRHPHLELSLVIEGSGYEVINGKSHMMKPGTFTFILPYQTHAISADKDNPLRLINCNFELELLYETGLHGFLEIEEPSHTEPFTNMRGSQLDHCCTLLMSMIEEYKSDRPYKNALIKSRFTEVMVKFERIRRAEEVDRSVIPEDLSFKKSIIWDIVKYAHQHYNEDISLTKLSKKFHVSTSHLSELFKNQLGLNYLHFVQELRIRHACSLLSSTDMPVTDISLEVGYKSFQTFSRVFREIKQNTPTGYRKNLQTAEHSRLN
ncbi:AraC family transcriptional regulator [Jeotgalibacillus terrae]|uniref:AraC family transcriptional regulator n=1 Tax=Jeotgalibacillus terrae TaxID=587735 RepID=A0ABW5ZIP8_9BACL|nr:AraC family transcriptional regulator [Jeotgalibacillus terrae]MBM7579633.1 AraC-like DNA-binding protein [Jeotgalibacillus terrae]